MKKLIVVLSILTLVFASSALAQDLDWQDNIGIYLADGSHSATGAPGTYFELSVVITNMTEPAAAGFEMTLPIEAPLMIDGASIAYPTLAINAATRINEFIVGFDTPQMAVNGALTVMTFRVLVMDDTVPGFLYISPIYNASIPGVTSYLADAGNSVLVGMKNSTGLGEPVFVVNSELVPVATESTSFDNLKSLYR